MHAHVYVYINIYMYVYIHSPFTLMNQVPSFNIYLTWIRTVLLCFVNVFKSISTQGGHLIRKVWAFR